MAVVIQEVVGQMHGERYYPNFSGTAASYNYYPLGKHLQPEDRIAFAALGLGKTVVDGGLSRRFSPKRPKVNIFASVEDEINSSQSSFFAIRLSQEEHINLEQGEYSFLESCSLREAIIDKTLSEVADTYDSAGGEIEPVVSGMKKLVHRLITFNRQLKYDTFPLAAIINRVLQLGEEAMGCPVEVEYAGDFSPGKGRNVHLQAAPITAFPGT